MIAESKRVLSCCCLSLSLLLPPTLCHLSNSWAHSTLNLPFKSFVLWFPEEECKSFSWNLQLRDGDHYLSAKSLDGKAGWVYGFMERTTIIEQLLNIHHHHHHHHHYASSSNENNKSNKGLNSFFEDSLANKCHCVTVMATLSLSITQRHIMFCSIFGVLLCVKRPLN